MKGYAWPSNQRLDPETVAKSLRNLAAPDRAALIAGLPDFLSATTAGHDVPDSARQQPRSLSRPLQ